MTHIKQRRDHSSVWTSANPVLMEGEVGWESNTGKAKLGDGVTAWNSLGYANPGFVDLSSLAPKANPSFTGVPKAPNAPDGDYSTQIATTVYVQKAIRGITFNVSSSGGEVDLTHLSLYQIQNAYIKLLLDEDSSLGWYNLPSATQAGIQFVLEIRQELATGGWGFSLPGIYKENGDVPISTTAGRRSLIIFISNGTNWLASSGGMGYTL